MPKGRHRSAEERIADLEKQIELQKDKLRQQRAKKELAPVIKDIPRVQKRLQKFAQLAMDDGRRDIANSTTMFLAGLNRIYQEAKAPEPVEVDETESIEA